MINDFKVGDIVRFSQPLTRDSSKSIGIVVNVTEHRGGMVWVHWNFLDGVGRNLPYEIEVIA